MFNFTPKAYLEEYYFYVPNFFLKKIQQVVYKLVNV